MLILSLQCYLGCRLRWEKAAPEAPRILAPSGPAKAAGFEPQLGGPGPHRAAALLEQELFELLQL